MSSSLKTILLVLPLCLFGILGFFLWQALGKDPNYLPSVLVGKPLPQFELTVLEDENKRVTHRDLTGQAALINVWATWCPSCIVEHPMLNRLASEGVRLIGLNYKDERASAIQYLKLHGNPFAITLFDEAGDLGLDLGVYGAPETFVVDKKGVIQYRFVGVIDERSWREELEPVFRRIQ